MTLVVKLCPFGILSRITIYFRFWNLPDMRGDLNNGFAVRMGCGVGTAAGQLDIFTDVYHAVNAYLVELQDVRWVFPSLACPGHE